MSVFWRLQLVGVGLQAAWLMGAYVFDWVGVEDWVYWVWAGIFAASWLIGGNVLLYRWRKDARRKSGLSNT